MQEANAVSIEYFRDFRRVADLLNGIIFHGKTVIKADDLQETNPVIHKIIQTGTKVSAMENTLDQAVMVTLEEEKFLLVIQEQTHEHYAMPVRVLNERGTDYYNQWKNLQKMHKESRDLRSTEELLSGMKQTDSFYPVLHVVIYFGKKKWDAARSMNDLCHINKFPKELQQLLTEKPILIFEICHFENLAWFKTDLQQICGFLQRTDDKNKLKNYVKENEAVFATLPEDAYNLLAVVAGINQLKLIKNEAQNIGGDFNMCKAFDDLMEDSRNEGKALGINLGLKQGIGQGEDRMGKLNQKLISLGRISDLMLASTDKKYRRELMVEFGIV